MSMRKPVFGEENGIKTATIMGYLLARDPLAVGFDYRKGQPLRIERWGEPVVDIIEDFDLSMFGLDYKDERLSRNLSAMGGEIYEYLTRFGKYIRNPINHLYNWNGYETFDKFLKAKV